MAEQNNVQSVERTFKIIELLSKGGEMSIKSLSIGTGLHKTTVFRLLNTLVSLGYVVHNSKTEKYRLSLKFLNISTSVLERYDIRKAASGVLKRLSKECGETVHLVQRSGSHVVYTDKFESPNNSIRMVSRVGMMLPMPFTAVGKAILAQLDDEKIKAIWESCEITKRTEKTITDFSDFIQEIAEVRQNGFAIDNEENESGVFCIAASLPVIGDEPACAFSISAPIQRVTKETFWHNVKLLLSARDNIIKNL